MARTSILDPRTAVVAACLAATALVAACGKKGPPLAPLNLVPDRPPEIGARVVDGTVYIRSVVPSKNANGPGAPAIDRIEVYAVTLDTGAVAPANRVLLQPSHVVGRIAVKPPPDPDAPVDEAAPTDTRPAPGEPLEFSEPLTPEKRAPEIKAEPAPKAGAAAPAPSVQMETESAATASSPEAVPAGGAAAGTGGTAGLPGGAAAGISAAFLLQVPEVGPLTAPGTQTPISGSAAAAPVAVQVPTRIYVLRGMTKKGRSGVPSARVAVALEPPPPPAPESPAASFSETAVTIKWPALAGVADLRYNVYDPSQRPTDGMPPTPLNAQPLEATTFDRGGIEVGVERCFEVRSVQVRNGVVFESAPSARACVTPRDVFPPAAPKALAAVAGAGAVNLIWDANQEPDLAGYLVLRGEATGDTLQPLTAEPIRETRYADATATPGVQYVYAVVAVDKAGNRSATSNRVSETAR